MKLNVDFQLLGIIFLENYTLYGNYNRRKKNEMFKSCQVGKFNDVHTQIKHQNQTNNLRSTRLYPLKRNPKRPRPKALSRFLLTSQTRLHVAMGSSALPPSTLGSQRCRPSCVAPDVCLTSSIRGITCIRRLQGPGGHR